MVGVVPHERADALVTVDADAAQRVRQPGGALAGLGIGAASRWLGPRAGDNLLVAEQGGPVPHDRRDRQRDVHDRAFHCYCRLHLRIAQVPMPLSGDSATPAPILVTPPS
jgi:hypothetical protein